MTENRELRSPKCAIVQDTALNTIDRRRWALALLTKKPWLRSDPRLQLGFQQSRVTAYAYRLQLIFIAGMGA